MDADVKKNWTCALRSGEYKQGKYVLKQWNHRDEIVHCCLGVLVELYMDEKDDEAKVEWEGSKVGFYHAVEKENRHVIHKDYLPKDVTEWAGLETGNPHVRVGENEAPLSILNDGEDAQLGEFTFDDIADSIEQSL